MKNGKRLARLYLDQQERYNLADKEIRALLRRVPLSNNQERLFVWSGSVLHWATEKKRSEMEMKKLRPQLDEHSTAWDYVQNWPNKRSKYVP